jgi:hypothetical protein
LTLNKERFEENDVKNPQNFIKNFFRNEAFLIIIKNLESRKGLSENHKINQLIYIIKNSENLCQVVMEV